MRSIPIFDSEENLPKELGELTYLKTEYYDDPRLGVTIRYERGITKADVSLYDLGLHDIPSHLCAPQMFELFKGAYQDIFRAVEMGMYEDLAIVTPQIQYFPNDGSEPMYLWATFRYKQSSWSSVPGVGFRISHLLMRTDGGYINKVRYTYPEELEEDNQLDMNLFLIEWFAAVPES